MIHRQSSCPWPTHRRLLPALFVLLALLIGFLLPGRPALAAHLAPDQSIPHLSVEAQSQATCSQTVRNGKMITGGAYAMRKAKASLPAAIITPVAPAQVLIAETAGGVSLAWSEQLENSAYEVWRSSKPYFSPQDPGSTLLTTTTLTAYTDSSAEKGRQTYYAVRGVNSVGEVSSPSYAVGRFHFNLLSGN